MWFWSRLFVPLRLAHEECQVCLQEPHTRSQSLPVEDRPQGQTDFLFGFFFFLSESISELGERVVANGLQGLPMVGLEGLFSLFLLEQWTKGLILRGLDLEGILRELGEFLRL